jgi:hypothetical protein
MNRRKGRLINKRHAHLISKGHAPLGGACLYPEPPSVGVEGAY